MFLHHQLSFAGQSAGIKKSAGNGRCFCRERSSKGRMRTVHFGARKRAEASKCVATVFVSEPNAYRRNLAKQLVPDAICLDPTKDDVPAFIREHTEEGVGVDVAIECVGLEAEPQLLRRLCPHGCPRFLRSSHLRRCEFWAGRRCLNPPEVLRDPAWTGEHSFGCPRPAPSAPRWRRLESFRSRAWPSCPISGSRLFRGPGLSGAAFP